MNKEKQLTIALLTEKLQKLTGKKVKLINLNEGFKANSGLVDAIRLYKKDPTFLGIDKSVIDNITSSGLVSSDVFSFAALFPRDSFKIEYIRNGRLEYEIKRLYFSGEQQNKNLEKAKALKDFVLAMDNVYHGDKSWPSYFK